MNIEQLHYICEVAKKGSLSSAAHSSHVTLSAISQSITTLEAELGIPLFTRARGAGAVPTPEGRVIIHIAAEILDKILELKEEASSFSNTLSGELRIASLPGPMNILVKTITNFKKDYPNVKIDLLEKGPKDILDDIRQNTIDIGLIVLNESALKFSHDLVMDTLFEGKIVVGASKKSPLADHAKITPEMMLQQPFVLYDDEYIREFVDRFIERYGEMDILFTSNNKEAIQQVVMDGNALTIGLDYSLKSRMPGVEESMSIIELDIEDPAVVRYGWVRKEKNFSTAAKRFLSRLQFEYNK